MLYHSARKGSRLATLRHAAARQERYTPYWSLDTLNIVGNIPKRNVAHLAIKHFPKLYDQLCKTPQ